MIDQMNSKSKIIAIISAMVVIVVLVFVVIAAGKKKENNYDEQLNQAQIYYDSMDYDNAIAIYNTILLKDELCAEAYAGLADAYYAKNNMEKTLQVLEKGILKTGNAEILSAKMYELFPDAAYAGEISATAAAETTLPEEIIPDESVDTEITTYEETEDVSESSETEETAVTTAATTVTTAETTVKKTEAQTTKQTTVQTTRATQKTTAKTTVTTTEKSVPMVVVPRLIGMTYEEAEEVCLQNSLVIKRLGDGGEDGLISSQSPAPGSEIEEGASIIVK